MTLRGPPPLLTTAFISLPHGRWRSSQRVPPPLRAADSCSRRGAQLGGLGFTAEDIGAALSVGGVVLIVYQTALFPRIVKRLGELPPPLHVPCPPCSTMLLRSRARHAVPAMRAGHAVPA